MFTQRKTAARRKLHSIHAIPNGKEFAGRIEVGKAVYQFVYAPATAAIENWKLVLTGKVRIVSPAGQTRTIDQVKATLLSTQGNVVAAPPVPATVDDSLKPSSTIAGNLLPQTEATGSRGSVAAMYLKLSPLKSAQTGIPLDLSAVQLNARLWTDSALERELHWLYSAVVMATMGPQPDDRLAKGYLTEINRRLG